MVVDQTQGAGDAGFEDAAYVFAGWGAVGEGGAFEHEEGDEGVLAVAGDQEGVVVGEEGEEVWQAEFSGLGGVGGGVDGGDARGGACEVGVGDLGERGVVSFDCVKEENSAEL